MSEISLETQVLETIVPGLEADGYTVYMHPSRQLIPPFMGSYIPDAIALGRPKNLAIEVVSEDPASKTKLQQLRERFRDAANWELRVYYARPTSSQASMELVSKSQIQDSVRNVEKLMSEGQTEPALLMAWATFEALGRALLPAKFLRPQTPGRLVEVLASEGHVTPDEADVLRRLAEARNRLIHGNLGVRLEPKDLAQFVATIKTVIGLFEETASSS